MTMTTPLESTSDAPPAGPYAEAALDYRALGWAGVLPAGWPEPGAVPAGYTGGRNWGIYPTDEQVRSWRETHGSWALGLRVPDDVIVLDVDCYDGKQGCDTLEWIAQQVGDEPPPTWYSTSRQDGSRKLFFRVARYQERAWTEPGYGLELLRHDHRWARVWPSLNPKTGAPERWFDPRGVLSAKPPRPSDLAELPPVWVNALRGARAATRTSATTAQRAEGVEGDPFDWSAFAGAVPPGAQNQTLFEALCSVRAGSEGAVRFMAHVLAQHLVNDPASPKGQWTKEAVDRVVRSALRYDPGRSVEELPPALARFVDGLGEAQVTPGRQQALEREANARYARRTLDAFERAEQRGPREKTTMRQLVAQPAVEQVLPGRLAADVNLLGGPSEAGKSLLARDWALEVAKSGRTVLWVASEGMDDRQVRWAGHSDWEEAADRVYFLDPVDLVGDADVTWLIEEYRQERPALVVFDLVYDMGLADDNGVKDVGPVFRSCKRLREAWGAGTLLLGHSGHNGERRFRGSSAWRQRAYVEWHLADGVLSCEKSKIADKSTLTKHCRIEYPSIRWLSAGEVLSRAATSNAERRELVLRDWEAHPDSTVSDRARRLEPQFGGLTFNRVRTLVGQMLKEIR
jgi:hypothetical protein